MLGEQIEDLKGKITSQRVIEVEQPTLETSVSSSGTIRGIQVNQILTFVDRPATTTSAEGQGGGVIHGKGVGTIMSGQSEEVAIFTGEGIGRIVSPSGDKVAWFAIL